MPEMQSSWWRRLSGAVWPHARAARKNTSTALGQFRREVGAAAEGTLDRAILTALLERPATLGLPDEEVELEIEVLQGALDLITLRELVTENGLPIVAHQHKALGDEACHFAASAFLASDATQRPGRLFFTDRRLVFLAAPLITLPWGAITRIEEDARDVIVAAPGRGAVHRFRCNSFSDARCGTWMGERLMNGGMLNGEAAVRQG